MNSISNNRRIQIVLAIILICLAGTTFLLCNGVARLSSAHKSRFPSRPPYNVILISIDTLAAKHLALYGGRVHTPNLEAFAHEASLFTHSFSTAFYTLPSHFSIFTGLNFVTHGLSLEWKEESYPALNPKFKTLPEMLLAQNYETVWCTHLYDPQLDLKRGFERGFQRFLSPKKVKLFMSQECEDWINAPHAKLFFLFNHTYLVHDPYTPPRPYYGSLHPHTASHIVAERSEFTQWYEKVQKRRRIQQRQFDNPERTLFFENVNLKDKNDVDELESLYEESILEMDARLGDYLSLLKKTGLWDRSIVIFTSDHGEAFGEHGKFMHNTLHNEVIQVPLLIHVPGQAASVHDQFVQSTDLVPTVLDLLGIENSNQFDGQSLVPLMRGGAWNKRSNLFAAHTLNSGFTVINERWSLLLAPGDQPPELYDFTQDRFQAHNIADLHPEVVQSLKSWGEQYRAKARQRAQEARSGP